jgi:AraC-like DNA-binding protein
MPKVSFASKSLPEALDDQARFKLWGEICNDVFCRMGFERPEDRPFDVTLEYLAIGTVGLGHFDGTISKVTRSARNIAADGNDDLCFGINLAPAPVMVSQAGQDYLLEEGHACLMLHTEPFEVRAAASNRWVTLNMPRTRLVERLANAEDLLAPPPGAPCEALQFLRRYVVSALGTDWTGSDPSVTGHIENTLIDLMTLVLGVRDDGKEMAERRGLRAARIQAILAEIRAGFADPAFSARDVALRLGLKPHYVQNLLGETGQNFSERVLELRLQKVRTMLANPGYDSMKVSDIAYACGFSEISYFNRCFRRRFGAAPSQYRNGTGCAV